MNNVIETFKNDLLKRLATLEEVLSYHEVTPEYTSVVKSLEEAMSHPDIEVYLDIVKANPEVLRKLNQYNEVTSLKKTIAADLMYCPNKLVITDGPLVSPAGASTAMRIFVQTDVAIHCDEIPRKVPSVGKELRVYNIEEMIDAE